METSGHIQAPAAGIHWIAGGVGPRARLDVLGKKKISCPLTGFETYIVQPVA